MGWILAAGLLGGAASGAQAGMSVGLRGGYADVNGEAFTGSGDIGGTGLFGLQAAIPLLPLVKLELAGEARNADLDFHDVVHEGASYRGHGTWKETALYITARISLPVTGLYGGLGGGWHFQETDLKDVAAEIVPRPAATPVAGSTDPIEEFTNAIEGKTTDWAWHAIAGYSISLPAIPISLFAELRYERVNASPARNQSSIYAGANLEL